MKNFSLIMFLFHFSLAFSQNLVPNFSFEQYDTCPSEQDQIQFATGWSKYSVPITTPDYYNACAPDTGFGVPKSYFCYQTAHRNCSAYAGLVTFDPNGYREHIGIKLSQPLIVGQKYFISFYTVMGGLFAGGNYFDMPSNNIGIRLATVANTESNPAPIDNFTHMRSIAVINDSINWTRISGSIITDSAYNYLIVGNFFDNANTDTIHYSCGFCLDNFSYYFIDDICVSTDSLLCNGGIDSLPCIVSINEIIFNRAIKIFPNPVSDIVTVSFHNTGSAEIILYNVFGKMVYTSKMKNKNTVNINMSHFSSGFYLLKIINEKNNQSTNRIIKL